MLPITLAAVLVIGGSVGYIIYSNNNDKKVVSVEQKVDKKEKAAKPKTEEKKDSSSADTTQTETASGSTSGGSKKSGGGSSSGGGGSVKPSPQPTGHVHTWVTGKEQVLNGQAWVCVGSHSGYVCSNCGTKYDTYDEMDACCPGVLHGWSSCVIPEYGWMDNWEWVEYTYCSGCGARK